MRVLAIGECMAELAPAGGAGAFTLGFAGDTFNTAWYLARIAPDVDVSYFTTVGDDAVSQDLRSFMQNSRINDAHVKTLKGATIGLYLIHLDNGERSFSYWRDSSAARQLAVDQAALEKAMNEAEMIYFSGITLAILDPQSRENLFSALQTARASGKTIAFDTNLRPRLWSSVLEMKAMVMKAAALSDIVLPSYDDEAEWFGDSNSLATLDRYSKIGVAQIVVKNSAQPVVFQQAGQRGQVTVDPAGDIVDTTAAGDSFNAGVLAGILNQADMASCIRQGCRLAGQVVQHKGALFPVDLDQGKATE
jgi:2-dehydro-3-deoxygluconokinase